MKLFSNKFLTTLIGGAALLFTACAEGDNVIDTVFDDTTRGAVLRTVSILSDEIPIGQASSSFGAVLEVQDQEDGQLVDFVEVYVGFRDNTDNGGPDNDRDQVLAETIDSSTFTIGEFGLPRFTYEITLPELLSTLGLADSDVDGGDQFEVRFELVLTDGRRFSRADNSATLTGSFFASPFLYVANVVCPPTAPTPGDWTFEMTDAYGDGWNGAALLFSVDGTVTEVLLAAGSAGTQTVTVPSGAQVVSLVYRSGDWDSEVGYVVTAATGNVVASQTAYTTAPVANVELINYCILNY